jgi:hypothetical protein
LTRGGVQEMESVELDWFRNYYPVCCCDVDVKIIQYHPYHDGDDEESSHEKPP